MKTSLTDSPRMLIARSARIPLVARGPGWLVMDKPCGVSIHNDPGKDLCSLVLEALREEQGTAVGREVAAFHAVHRLDRDTSGIVLLAGDSTMLAFFGEQFRLNTIGKRYLALVHGRPEGTVQTPDRGEWNWPLTAAAAGRKDPVGKGNRLPCSTRWRILIPSRHYTLIECEPASGRQHQIRRHAKLAGHPIVGDRRYGSTRALAYLNRRCHFNRLALHAHALTIRLPGETGTTTFQSGGLPEAMRQLLDADREAGTSTAVISDGSA